jgi:hypothetical protein
VITDEEALLIAAIKRLIFAALTSGGVAGRDAELCAACEQAANAVLLVEGAIAPE